MIGNDYFARQATAHFGWRELHLAGGSPLRIPTWHRAHVPVRCGTARTGHAPS